MGLPIPSMRLIIREHKKEPLKGHVLTLGRMAVLATYKEILNLFKEEGVTPKALDEDFDTRTNISSMRKSIGKMNSFTSDVVFFKLLGVDYLETLDISTYENADIIHDMNTPVPKNLVCRFDAIFDFGTTEHIFNTQQTLDNINLMLKPDGRVLHLVPATNRIGHGYYMFSPELFYDYYWANKFIDCQGYLVELNRGDPSFIKWKLYRYRYDSYKTLATSFKSPNGVGTFFVARKTKDSTSGITPAQRQFQQNVAKVVKTAGNNNPASIKSHVKKYTPASIKKLYRSFQALRQRRKNGGLEYLRKI